MLDPGDRALSADELPFELGSIVCLGGQCVAKLALSPSGRYQGLTEIRRLRLRCLDAGGKGLSLAL